MNRGSLARFLPRLGREIPRLLLSCILTAAVTSPPLETLGKVLTSPWLDSKERQLIIHLMGKHQKLGPNIRPVLNVSTAVPVLFGLGLIQMDLNEKDNILSMSMWTRYAWRDEFLQWDPADFGGITSIRVRSDQVWIPDIMLYNTANVEKESRDALAIVTPDGSVSWYPHCIFRSACSVDVTDYPFDIQNCHLWFGSWTYPAKEVDLNISFPGGIDLTTFQSDYKETSKWEVVNVTAHRQMMPPDDPDYFAVLTFDLFLRRRMVFSTYMLTLPCVFLACLTLVVFWLPPERPDRTQLAMSSFASFMVLLLILVEAAMPTASSVPTLGMYYCFNLVIIMVAIFLSSLVVNVSRGKTRERVPKWMLFIAMNILAQLLCYQKLSREIRAVRAATTESDSRQRKCACSKLLGCTKKRKDSEDPAQEKLANCNSDGVPGLQRGMGGMTLAEIQVTEVRKSLQRIEMKLDERRAKQMYEAMVAREWRAVASVLDRLFFCLYVVLIALSLILFFPRSKNST